MKIRYVAIGAAVTLLLGAAVTVLSFEVVTSEPLEDLPEGVTPITPTVGRTTTPVGVYMVAAGIAVLIGSGIYSLARSLKRGTGRRG
ncbi:MAG: hypothetical protein J4F28_07060 [Nitrosopumilaceae archaeon]|nr:hypothetical protein [Nitrosopumilaceae archaeon]